MITRQYNQVSLLITHYNRSASLERLLNSFQSLNCTFGEIVVSDDGSSSIHLEKLNKLANQFNFKLVLTPVNRGLGNNINKGQDAVSKPYTLYIQEDFIPKKEFPENLDIALELMDKFPEMDIARFYAYFKYAYTRPLERGFEQMIFKWWYPGYMKFYSYSDHPHLRRSDFLNKFGRYLEGANVDITEFKMSLSFLKNKGQGFIFNQIDGLFDQANNAAEPSTALYRKDWKNSDNMFIRLVRKIYLQYKTIKCHKEYLFYPTQKKI